MRTFVAVADRGRFHDAAQGLEITQQAVSKRVAALERSLGVSLFTRAGRRARLTVDGQSFLPRARELLLAADRAADAVRPGRRPLRVEVASLRSAPAALLREYGQARPEVELEVVSLADPVAAFTALNGRSIDATFRPVTAAGLTTGVKTMRVLDDAVQLLTGPRHALAGARSVTIARLAGHRIWLPGSSLGTEWAAYHTELAAAFDLTTESLDVDDGDLLSTLADSRGIATLIGERSRVVWPSGYDLRQIPITEPTPIYPHSLAWRGGNSHPGLGPLRDHLEQARSHRPRPRTWTPSWARRPVAGRSS